MDVKFNFQDLLEPADFRRQRRINRMLRWAPRLSVLGRIRLAVTRQAFRLSTIGSAQRVSGRGISFESGRMLNDERTPVRIFRSTGTQQGLLVDFHGGAWAVGLAAMDDKLNAGIARQCGLTVASIDYRLALPRSIAAVRQECIEATQALLRMREFRDLPVFFTGESAGGHLALSVAQAMRSSFELAGRFAGILLNYGAYDLVGTPSALAADKHTLILHGSTLQEQIDLLCRDVPHDQRRNPELSPLYGRMDGLPPTLVVAGGLDPLLDDSRQLTARLLEAGVDAEFAFLPEAPHGLIHMSGPYAAKLRKYERDWYNRQIAQFNTPMHAAA